MDKNKKDKVNGYFWFAGLFLLFFLSLNFFLNGVIQILEEKYQKPAAYIVVNDKKEAIDIFPSLEHYESFNILNNIKVNQEDQHYVDEFLLATKNRDLDGKDLKIRAIKLKEILSKK